MDSPAPIKVAVVVLASDYDRDIQILRLQVAALTATGKVLGGGLDLVLPQRDQLAADNKRLDDLIRYEEARCRLELAESERLRKALQAIDRHNDSPARYDAHIDQIIKGALSSGKEVGV
jgi:hypothetical protein